MSSTAKNYKRTREELEAVASMFWPPELSRSQADLSVIPHLLRTQDQFISILNVDFRDVQGLFSAIDASEMRANLFVKHLVILSDFGGEMLKRVSREHATLFPGGSIAYYWHGEARRYAFRALGRQKFSNATLGIDGRALFDQGPLTDLQRDAIMLLLFGSVQTADERVATTLARCEIGNYLGKPQELAQFIKQRYIWVSRVTGGATANSLGQLAQAAVAKHIEPKLAKIGARVNRGGRLPGVTHTDDQTGRPTSFDLVVTDGRRYAAVEVSFQVTTNSVIERKSGQARARYEQIREAGHRVAYVIDGSGNFERATALEQICRHSDCTVAFSPAELDLLLEFLIGFFRH